MAFLSSGFTHPGASAHTRPATGSGARTTLECALSSVWPSLVDLSIRLPPATSNGKSFAVFLTCQVYFSAGNGPVASPGIRREKTRLRMFPYQGRDRFLYLWSFV